MVEAASLSTMIGVVSRNHSRWSWSGSYSSLRGDSLQVASN
jgi:hypothetical protein